MKIQSFGISACNYDFEYQEIIRRLLVYGITPTGNKTTDKAKLKEIELEKAKESSCVLPKLFTVSLQEQEKFQLNKKENTKEQSQNIAAEEFEGSKALGEQLYLAIKMKKR